MIKVGQKVRFDPFESLTGNDIDTIRKKVTGTVVYINAKHRWFSVVYGNGRFHISFHFCEIGKKVKLL